MTIRKIFFIGTSFLSLVPIAGCGLYTPEKDEVRSDTAYRINGTSHSFASEQADYENLIVVHVECEIREGIAAAQKAFQLPWLERWGTAVTITISAIDQGAVNPGLSLISPIQNVAVNYPTGGLVTLPQSFTAAIGATGAATSTRTETIQYTYLNSDLIRAAKIKPSDCKRFQRSIQIDGDLKIRQFIFDKALLAKMGNTSEYGSNSDKFNAKKFIRPKNSWEWPTFNTLTEEIQFLSAYGGNFTPTWKLARISADTAGSLLAAQRTYTNDLIITMGPVHPPTEFQAASLDTAAQNQHNAKVNANAIATSIQSQMH